MKRCKSSYAAAGVDIDEMAAGLEAIKRMVKGTSDARVLSELGAFGGLFESPGKNMVLVASTDGVGTKLKVAAMAGRHGTVGQDIVNHCVNDILVQGAEPLFFLDYLGTSRLDSAVFAEVIWGICKACRENGCALLGGETAEMPGLYPRGEYDLVGTIIGCVPRRGVVTGAKTRPGDVLLGLPSSGFHTNGYSLARKVVFERAKLKIDDRFPGTRRTVADVLLAVHRSYLKPVRALMAAVPVKGMAHITGGGFLDNIPRTLPAGCSAEIDCSKWKVPAEFAFVQEAGQVSRDEMFRVFNMGIGYIITVAAKQQEHALRVLRAQRARPVLLGRVVRGDRRVVLLD